MTQPETPPTEGQQAADWLGPQIFLTYRPTKELLMYANDERIKYLRSKRRPIVRNSNYLFSSGYCSVIEPLSQPIWQTLFPQTRFYRISLVGRTMIKGFDGAKENIRQVMVAWQTGQGYRVENFDQLLQVNKLTIGPTNQTQVAQAFIMMALPDYLSHEFKFGQAEAIDQPGLRLRYNYTMTVWTRLYGLQLKWYFTFLEGRLRLAVSECKAKEQGRYFEAPLTISAERVQAERLYPFPPLSEGEQAADWLGKQLYPQYQPTQVACEYTFENSRLLGSVYSDSIEPVLYPVWQALFPHTRFYRIGFQGRHHRLDNDRTYSYRLVAWQAGQGYDPNTFDQLLAINQIIVTEANVEQVAQAFVLLTLGNVFTDSIRFSCSHTIDTGDDTYALTVWIAEKQVEWHIIFHQGKFQRAIRESDYHYASQPQTELEQVAVWWGSTQYGLTNWPDQKPIFDHFVDPPLDATIFSPPIYRPARCDCLELIKMMQADKCDSLQDIHRFDHPVWAALFPQTRFYYLGVLRDFLGYNKTPKLSHHLIAWQAGKGYEVKDFSKFLEFKGFIITPDNRELVTQVRVLFNTRVWAEYKRD